ncbi:hypothetical protein FSP39_015455 [Pinctada imbricata]|uniref:Uncharacterized protein n=1 Tax=Pinctada imbricata TaxID=66713 RepID=A0AA89BJG2_PINIB|nr:hypothetical protein FSP39_015455 [Pinctada imbricata]
MTTDCINTRRKRLIRKWPSDIRLNSSSVFIGSCSSKFGVFQGQLKDLIFLPGADASVRTCPPRIPHHTHMDNSLPAHPDIFRQNSPGPRWEDCTWMDVGNIAYDLHANSLKVCVNGIWQHVTLNLQAPSPKLPKRLDYLEFYKDLKTPGPSIDVEVFRIEGEGLFCVLASSRGRRKKKDVSVMYKWTAGEFVPYQRIPTDAAQCWEHFTIGSNFFLAVANYGDNSADPTNSTIYKWNRRKKRFKEFQSIITWTARDFEYFEIDNDHFLAVANHARGRSQSVDSIIYKWNRKERRFREHQVIPTVGAYDWTYFTVNNFHFLAVAQAFDGLTTLLDSKIFVLQNNEFIFFQAIETTGATDWEFFSIKEDSFLVVANAYNYGPQNFMNKNQYQTNSTVYRLDKDRRVFKKFQTFKTYSAIDWEFFSIENDHYLVVSNAQNSNIEQDLQTAIYRWQGADKFVLVHEMFTLPNSDWEIFEEDGDVYFLYSNAKGRTSQIYKAVFTF